jgi:hypothetical protein
MTGALDPPEQRRGGMLRFYLALAKQAPRALWDAFGLMGSIVSVVVFALTLANRSWADALSGWDGISPRWALVLLTLLFAFGMARANYGDFEREREKSEAALRAH